MTDPIDSPRPDEGDTGEKRAGHLQGHRLVGEGRAVTHQVTCICGWSRTGDGFYWPEQCRAAWNDHAIESLLIEVEELRAIASGRSDDR